MGYMIEITEHKLEKATDYAEKMLKYGGMLMQCLSEWEEESGFGERSGSSRGSSYGSRYGGYGSRYGERSINYRDEEEWGDEEMNERRGGRRRRDSMGRYR